MGTLQPLMYFAACWALAGCLSAAEVKGPVDKLEPKVSPNSAAVKASNDFACDLYRGLDQENRGKNLFFSPYSINSALAMTLEGARGATAAEMGQVMRLPEALRSTGGDAKELPWTTALYHQDFGALNRRFNAPDDPVKDKAQRRRLAELRQELEQMNREMVLLDRQNQFQAASNLQAKGQKVADAINALQTQLDPYELRVANALFGEKTYPFERTYLDIIGKHYGSGLLRHADFRNSFPAERGKINAWVEEQTKQRIRDLIPKLPPELGSQVRLILVNAIYFKGFWMSPFDEKQTRKEEFLLADGGKQPVAMMRGYSPTGYAAFNADGAYFDTPHEIAIEKGKAAQATYPEDGFLMAELPFKGDRLSMTVIAPRKQEGLPKLEAGLTGEKLSAWLGKLQRRAVILAMPKFKLETDYGLHDTLKNMGMTRAFDARLADFSGMSASRNPDDQLFISKVLHKAFVEVNEKGAEAAAATAAIMVPKDAKRETRPFIPEFRADRPFLFLIRDRESGAILFLGRVTQPG
jgi:serine protease inhibitor